MTAREYSGVKVLFNILLVPTSRDRARFCRMALTKHGFVGREKQTVRAILAWIRTGQAPGNIGD